VNLPVEVIDAVRDGRCLIFVGSRFTAESRLAAGQAVTDGNALARSLGWTRPKPRPGSAPTPVTPSVQQGATDYEARHGREELEAAIDRLVGGSGLTPTSAHRAAVGHFRRIFTTAWDDLLEDAAAQQGVELQIVGRGEPIPDLRDGTSILVRLRNGGQWPRCVTTEDHAQLSWDEDTRRQMRKLIRGHVVLFVGYRPDEEEFEALFGELSAVYGAELPRCHLAVAQGRIEDYQWQRWVWRGLLLFTADPTECMDALVEEFKEC